jgi:hypothetical protein
MDFIQIMEEVAKAAGPAWDLQWGVGMFGTIVLRGRKIFGEEAARYPVPRFGISYTQTEIHRMTAPNVPPEQYRLFADHVIRQMKKLILQAEEEALHV